MDNLTAFGELLNQQMQNVRKAGEERTLEFGTIGDDLSLTVDSLKDVIPKGDYLLALRLTALTGDRLTSSEHTHVLPEPLRGIRPGDRVIVAWVGGQPIVMDTVAGSRELTLDGR